MWRTGRKKFGGLSGKMWRTGRENESDWQRKCGRLVGKICRTGRKNMADLPLLGRCGGLARKYGRSTEKTLTLAGKLWLSGLGKNSRLLGKV
jgi:hypothetical protein